MDHLLFGAAYYDEYMPFDRIETDMQMMKKANMNVIRIAESTWSTLEPQDGVFDFTHLDRMLDAAEKYDMHVIIGTPTYAIPSWLAKKSDTILAITKDGPSLYGHRQNMDITDPTYLKYAERIIRTLMEHIKDQALRDSRKARPGTVCLLSERAVSRPFRLQPGIRSGLLEQPCE